METVRFTRIYNFQFKWTVILKAPLHNNHTNQFVHINLSQPETTRAGDIKTKKVVKQQS